MKLFLAILSLICWNEFSIAQDVKTITDCTVFYDITVSDPNADPQLISSLQGSSKVVYMRSNKIRTDLITQGFLQTTLMDLKSDTSIILREFGNNKYLTYLNQSKRAELKKRFEKVLSSC